MTRSIRLDGPVLIEVADSPSSEGARAGHFVEKLGYYLLEEVYFVPPGGGRNPKRV